MGITLTDEQEELRDLVRAFLAEKAPSEAVRRWMETDAGYDPELWRQMATQLGLHGLALPERYGGAGYGLSELAVVFEEMGRSLLPAPFFSTIGLAAQTLLASGDDEACGRYLPGIAQGELTATVAVCDENGSWNLADITTSAGRDDGDWRLSGTKMFVIDGQTADVILVVARADDGLGLFAVAGGTPGLATRRLEALDPTRRLARVDLKNCQGRRIGPPGDATAFLRRAIDVANVVLAAEQVGGAQACLDDAVAYAKFRVQFNRPIGSFQAIKHKCADVLLEIESAKAALLYAASLTGRRGLRGGGIRDLLGAGFGVLCGRLHPRGQGEHPDSRWHRLYLGARRPSLSQARQDFRVVVRGALGAPGPDRRSRGHLRRGV